MASQAVPRGRKRFSLLEVVLIGATLVCVGLLAFRPEPNAALVGEVATPWLFVALLGRAGTRALAGHESFERGAVVATVVWLVSLLVICAAFKLDTGGTPTWLDWIPLLSRWLVSLMVAYAALWWAWRRAGAPRTFYLALVAGMLLTGRMAVGPEQAFNDDNHCQDGTCVASPGSTIRLEEWLARPLLSSVDLSASKS
jgi:hypothetical protein